jgi:hypothetical protein
MQTMRGCACLAASCLHLTKHAKASHLSMQVRMLTVGWLRCLGTIMRLQESMSYRTVESRLHVWMLLNSIDIAPHNDAKCWENQTVRHPTQIYGRLHDSAKTTHSSSTYTFDFKYLQDALVLPPTAEARFFSIFNTTLIGLPQGPNPRAAATVGRLAPDALTLLIWSIYRYAASLCCPCCTSIIHL